MSTCQSVLLSVVGILVACAGVSGAGQELQFMPVDEATGQRVACRMHLKDSAGKVVLAPGLPAWKDHFDVGGTTWLDLAPGKYAYEVERGPEYLPVKGEFELGSEGGKLPVKLKRMADLASRGWWSGELHVHRPIADIEVLMRAEDLHVAPVITWWGKRSYWGNHPIPSQTVVRFDQDRIYDLMAGEDERAGGALLYFRLPRPLPLGESQRDYPSSMKWLDEAKKTPGVHVDIEKPFWWDVPVWLASGEVDSIGIANNHMDRDQMSEKEALGKPRDATRLPPPRGNGYWSQEIYYQILNSGLRIAPSAGSASGVLPNPVGYNRVYVQIDGPLTYDKWFEGLRAGRSFVTNGPLLLVHADGELPGHVFKSNAGKELELSIELISHDKINSIEVIKNGVVTQTLPPAATAARIKFDSSGWMLVRAIADNPKTFRFASTAPFYVEIGDAPRRISRSSVRFFLNWIDERTQQIKLPDPDQQKEVLAPWTMARSFWQKQLEKANAD